MNSANIKLDCLPKTFPPAYLFEVHPAQCNINGRGILTVRR